VEKSDPRARSDTERPDSWLPAPGLETTLTIKLGRRQRTAATADFPTRTGVHVGTSEAWKAATMPCLASAHAGHHHGVALVSDRECPCLLFVRARIRVRIGHGLRVLSYLSPRLRSASRDGGGP
jgi:hypothetical protein